MRLYGFLIPACAAFLSANIFAQGALNEATLVRFEVKKAGGCGPVFTLSAPVESVPAGDGKGTFTFNQACGPNTATGTLRITVPTVMDKGRADVFGTIRFPDPIPVSATYTVAMSGPFGLPFVTLTVPPHNAADATGEVTGGTCPLTASAPLTDFSAPAVASLNCQLSPHQFEVTRDGVRQIRVEFKTVCCMIQAGEQPARIGIEVDAVYQLSEYCPVPDAARRVVSASCDEDLSVDHIEIIQAVQNRNGLATLIQGRSAVVRVFLKSVGPNAQELRGITGQAEVVGGKKLNLLSKGAVGYVGDLFPDSETLDFELPAEYTRVESLAVDASAKLVDEKGADRADANPTNNRLSTPPSFRFQKSTWPETYRIGYLPVCIKTASGRKCPNSDIQGARRLIGQLLPAEHVRVYGLVAPVLIIDPDPLHSPRDMVSTMISLFREYLLVSHYGELFGRPIPDYIVFDVAANSEGAPGPSADDYFAKDPPGSLWLTRAAGGHTTMQIAHGIAHSAGLSEHYSSDRTDLAESTASFYDAATTSVLDQAVAQIAFRSLGLLRQRLPGYREQLVVNSLLEISYGGWVSPGEWNKLHELGFPGGKTSTKAASAAETERLVISGSVAQDGLSGTLDSGFRITSTGAAPASDPDSDICLRFTGAGAASDYCFSVTFVTGIPDGYFAVSAPYPDGTQRVALMRGGRELASLIAGTAPQVSILAPAGGESWQGVQKIRWSSAEPQASFRVDYSPDGGTSWLPLSPVTAATEFEFDTASIAGGNDVRFRVTATSGIATSTATSPGVRIPQNGRLTLASSGIQFRNLTVGYSQTKTIEFTNTGTSPLLLPITAPTNAAFHVDSASFLELRAGESDSLNVRFSPSVAGPQVATVRIGEQSVTLQGAGFTTPVPSIEFGAEPVDFGHVQTGTTKETTVKVINGGLAPLQVTSLSVSGPGLTIVTPVPIALNPGAEANVILRLTNAAAGVQGGILTVNSTDPSRGQIQLAVSATGVNGPVPAATAAGVLNAASFRGGAVSPGEIVTIFGTNIGPASLAGLQLTPQGTVSTQTGETRVLFDGVPAPIVYALAGQTSVIVPYAVEQFPATQMVIEYQGRRSDPVTLEVTAAAPGIFSANSSGTGPGAILNADFTLNTASNPAAKGSFVVLFGTGEGATNPPGIDGRVSSTVFPKPADTVTVTIGGIAAQVLYAGAAPELVAGVLQLNVVVPPNAPSGSQPVVVKIGDVQSQAGLTVAVQ